MASDKPPSTAVPEEDDEFEEFQEQDWGEQVEDPEDARIWETSWDDEDVSDDFSQQLKQQLAAKPS